MLSSPEFDNADDLRAHYKAVRARVANQAPQPAAVEKASPEAPQAPETPEQKKARKAAAAELAEQRYCSAVEELTGVPHPTRATPCARALVAGIAARHGVEPQDIYGPRRDQKVVMARFEAIAAIHKLLPWSLPKIGRFFGNRDHTTILHALRRVKEMADRA